MMTSLPFPTLAIDSRLGRHRVLEARADGTYLAEDDTGQRVLLVALTEAEAARAESLKGAPHAHLVKVHELVESEGARFLVTECVAGTTLRELLSTTPSEAADTAANVRTLLRLADVVSHLHGANLWHGRVSAESLFVDLDDGSREAPVLSFAAAAAAPYLSPERGEAGAGSADDDTWAVATLVLEMLTGKTTPNAGFAKESELTALGVDEPALRMALFVALGSTSDARREGLRLLRRSLARHFVHQSDDESVPAGVHSSAPPPLPSLAPEEQPSVFPQGTPSRAEALPAARRPASEREEPPRSEKRKMPFVAVTGLVVGLGVAWALKSPAPSASSQPDGSAAPKAQAQSSSAKDAAQGSSTQGSSAQGSSIQMNEVAVSGEEESAAHSKLASCVAGYLPKGAVESPRDLGWVCKETDPAQGAAQLSKTVSAGSDAAKGLEAMGPLSQVAFAVVQKGCCDAAGSLTATDARCDGLGPALSAAGKAVIDGAGVASALDGAAAAVTCAGGPAPSEGQRKALSAYTEALSGNK